jgi:hypothetical protein
MAYERAVDYLHRLLADGPMPANEAMAAMREAGFRRAHIFAAKKILGVGSWPVYRKVESKTIDHWEWIEEHPLRRGQRERNQEAWDRS